MDKIHTSDSVAVIGTSSTAYKSTSSIFLGAIAEKEFLYSNITYANQLEFLGTNRKCKFYISQDFTQQNNGKIMSRTVNVTLTFSINNLAVFYKSE